MAEREDATIVLQVLRDGPITGCVHERLDPHTCPYKVDIAGDDRLCTCCAECVGECAADI